MIIPFEALGGQQLPRVVIIGSGPAGSTLAVDLGRRGIGALVLEAGGDGFDADSQTFYEGAVIGDPYFDLDATRMRQWGGSSNHWYGRCRHLEEWDFAAREDVPDSGWPITRAAVDPYQQRAQEILEIGEMHIAPLSGDLLEISFPQSPPVNFADKYRALFESSADTHIALNTAVTSIEARGGRITALNLRGPGGAQARIQPEIAVVAVGGIETSRLLLWSNEVSPERVVAEPAALGRYWMEHPHDSDNYAQMLHSPGRYRSVFDEFHATITPDAMKRYGILNGIVRVTPTTTLTSGIKKLAKGPICATHPVGTAALRDYAGVDVGCENPFEVNIEQAPVESNRVALSASERDPFGVPRAELHWRVHEMELRSMKIIVELFGRYLQDTGQGRVRPSEWVRAAEVNPDHPNWGVHHHIGGARMAASPRKGVVDENLKIHGLSNGYVVGSSIFPTGGFANPTFSIVQFSLRLSEHLAREVG